MAVVSSDYLASQIVEEIDQKVEHCSAREQMVNLTVNQLAILAPICRAS